MLHSYQILCLNCKKPFPIKDISAHESFHCKNTVCANELCSMLLEPIPEDQRVRFKILNSEKGLEEKVACSKKCKKVAKFGFVLKLGSESEALRAFEKMMRTKMTKRQHVPGLTNNFNRLALAQEPS